MRINTLLSLVCALFVTCTESLRIPYLSRLHKMNLPCKSPSKSGETNKAALPKWLVSRDEIPPYWLLSDDLPPWFLAEGPPNWLFEKCFKPPAWMLQDEIPRIITTSYGNEGPPLWLLKMDRLPQWFSEVDILPSWFLTFQEVPPPKWALNDSISEWLKRGNIPDWVADEDKVTKIDRWLHNADEKYPRWMIEGKYPSWMENIPNKLQKTKFNPNHFDSHETFDQNQKYMEKFRNDQKRAFLMKAGNLVLKKKAADVYKINRGIQKLPDIIEFEDDIHIWEDWDYHSYGEKAMMELAIKNEQYTKDIMETSPTHTWEEREQFDFSD